MPGRDPGGQRLVLPMEMIMKKRLFALVLAVMTAASLAGCGGKNESAAEAPAAESTEPSPAYTSGVNAAEYVSVPEYIGIPVTAAQPSVTDEYLDMYLDYQLSMSKSYEEITDRDVVQDGDTVNIDYVGKKGEIAFQGGTDADYNLTIGSGTFIEGFEEGLIGAKKGEKVKLNLTFPENYGNADLAGQDVVFEVTINKIQTQVTPELDDAYVAKQNIPDVTTVDEYRAYVRGVLMDQAESQYETDVENQISDYIFENSSLLQDPPAEMTDRMFNSYVNSLTQMAAQYGLDLDTYVAYAFGTAEDEETEEAEEAAGEEAAEETAEEAADAASEETTEEAETEEAAAAEAAEEAAADAADAASSEAPAVPSHEKRVRQMAREAAQVYMTMQAIADRENLNITDEEFNEELALRAEQGGYEDVDALKAAVDTNAYREYLMVQNVLDFLRDKAVISEPEETTEEAVEETAEEITEEVEEQTAEEAAVAEEETELEKEAAIEEAADELAEEMAEDAAAEAK